MRLHFSIVHFAFLLFFSKFHSFLWQLKLFSLRDLTSQSEERKKKRSIFLFPNEMGSNMYFFYLLFFLFLRNNTHYSLCFAGVIIIFFLFQETNYYRKSTCFKIQIKFYKNLSHWKVTSFVKNVLIKFVFYYNKTEVDLPSKNGIRFVKFFNALFLQ